MSAIAPVLATKLYVPRARSNLIARPRLTAQLTEPFTLICAPAGFGKTTLLSEWIHANDRRVAWVTLDTADNDPTRFWTYIVTALQTLHDDLGKGALPLLQSAQPSFESAQPSFESVLALLLNDIVDFADECTLVLDDYHTIENQSLHDALNVLLDHLPPRLHLILTSRSDPPPPLSRLRLSGQLVEIRADDLRFTSDEAAAFLNQAMGLNLSADHIAALEGRTEGWIAALQLVALSMQERENVPDFIAAFTGSHRFIADYLAEEVLQRQTPEVSDFLLRTSILDRLCGPLCDHLTGQTNGQMLLEQLERANLFLVMLDHERNWYRYHQLFADVLRNRLQQSQPDLETELHRRASEWYEANGLIDDAIKHALAISDVERAAQLIEREAQSLFKRGEDITVQGWLNALPKTIVHARPRLALFRARILMRIPQLDAAETYLQDAENATAVASAAVLKSVLGEIVALRADIATYRNDLPLAIKLGNEALEVIPADNQRLRARVIGRLGGNYALSGDLVKGIAASAEAARLAEASGDLNAALYSIFNQGTMQNVQGRLHQAVATQQHGLALAQEHAVGSMPITALIHRDLAEMFYQWNDLERALIHVKEAITLSERGALPRILVVSNIPLANILNSQGDASGALETLTKAEQLIHEHSLPIRYSNLVTVCKVWLWLAQENIEAATTWAQTCGLSVDDELDYLHEALHLALARVLIAQGDFGAVTIFLRRLREAAEADGRLTDVIWISIAEAIALHGTGDTNEALTYIERTLSAAESEGYIRAFVDQGEPARALITQVRVRIPDTRLRSYVDRLLATFPESKYARTKIEVQDLIEPLTERELEVLRLLADGLSDPQIAEQLSIAVSTAKRHLSNLYGKLDAHSRTQALARAEELGLL